MSQFDEIVRRFHEHFTVDPNACVSLGVTKHLGDLPDPSLAAQARHVAEGRALIEAIDDFPADEAAALGFDQELDLELARMWLERDVFLRTFTFNGATSAAQTPTAGDDIGGGIFTMFINDPRVAAERLESITQRLHRVPEHLDAMLGRLDTPVARWVSMDLEKVEGLPSLFETVEGWAAGIDYPNLDELRVARATAEEALASYAARLRKLPTTTQLHAGEAVAERIVHLNGIELSTDALHDIAKNFLARTAEEVEELRGTLAARYGLPADASVEAVQEHLNRRFAIDIGDGPLERVLEVYEDARTTIMEFIDRQSLFPIPANQDIRVLRTPPFMAPSIPAGAMMAPPPFRPGVRTSLVYLTLSRELLDEHTALSIPVMMIHEGIPGHHLQLASAAENPSVVRRHMWNAVHGEGWTTMLEDYMLDLGFMGDLTDEARFIGKRDLARLGARVAIDLFFMSGDKGYLEVGVPCDLSSGDPFVAAGNLLRAVTGFTPGRVRAELNWYSQERGYPLCYLTGNHLVWALKRELAAHNAGRLEGLALDRAFHRVYLQSGNMPISFLRRCLQREGLL